MFQDGLQGEPSTREGLRTRDLTAREPLQRFEEQLAQSIGGRGVKKIPLKPRGQWSNKALIAAIDALDDGHKMQDVSNNFGIPRSTLREHYVGKRKSRKIGPKGVLITMAEETSLVQYLEEMVRVSCPLNITQLKLKVAEITQTRMTPFTHGILGKSWIKWFRQRHPNLVLRFPQPLDLNRARALCPQSVEQFYQNLESLYQQHNYETS